MSSKATTTPRFMQRKPVIYASCALGSNLMHAVFSFYYVKVYLDYYHIPEQWFHMGQMLYMIWNAINDPLLGYCQDHCDSKYVRSRRHTILYGAPIWALTFLLPWIPWPGFEKYSWLRGVHMIVAMSAYDTMFTHVLLAHGCVLAEMAETHEERVTFLFYHGIASFIGASSVLFCETFSNHLSSFKSFQLCCMVIAVLAYFFISYTGKYAVTKYDLRTVEVETSKQDTFKENTYHGTPLDLVNQSRSRATEYSVCQLTWQILKQRNFFTFVLVNFLSEFHQNFVASMSRVISEALIAVHVTSGVWSVYCGAIMILPRLVIVMLMPVLPRLGYYRAYRFIFSATIVSSMAMYMWGFSPAVFMAYTIFDSMLAGCSVNLMGLPLTDIIDEDHKHYKRRHPVSSMVFGTNALITKPAVSLAPMLAVTILNRHGYGLYQTKELSGDMLDTLHSAMFTLNCLLPIIVAFIQMIIWTMYNIRNSHVNVPKYQET